MALTSTVDVANRHSDQVAIHSPEKLPAGVRVFRANGLILPGRVVKFDTGAGQVIQSVAATDLHIGVYIGDKNANIGDDVAIAVDGICTAEAGAAITQGAMLSVDATGRVVAAASGNLALAKALQSAAAAAAKITVVLTANSAAVA